MNFLYIVATSGQRIGAMALDGLLFFAGMLPLGLLLGKGFSLSDSFDFRHGLIAFSLLVLVILGIVQCVMLARFGQTVGKRKLGIRVVQERDGQPPGFYRAVFLREVVFWLIVLIPVVGQVLLVMTFCRVANGARRCWRDKMAGTIVVQSWD